MRISEAIRPLPQIGPATPIVPFDTGISTGDVVVASSIGLGSIGLGALLGSRGGAGMRGGIAGGIFGGIVGAALAGITALATRSTQEASFGS